MGNDKKDNDQNKAREGIKRKRQYEPPKLTAVSLFADQVLGVCNKLPNTTSTCDLLAFMS
ncbi:hypothetical protein H206_00544 [Candidatus Electrothrix aarhusensis]|uniref:Uncharacterized protein n=1 Tax=Candidatus Electrothrix aarhusensis TaxID=1859131 RepID=A0A444J2N0_9BACT|nr:hypothetical protein H206_00544 [Candidatus Electrothrix aarhusensis]